MARKVEGPKTEAEGPAQLKLRVDPKLRRFLERSAHTKGVSINREVTDRLSRDVTRDVFDDQVMFYHPRVRGIMALLATAMRQAEQAKGTSWFEDAPTWALAVEAANVVLNALRPPGAVETNEANYKRQKAFSELVAQWTIENVLAAKAGQDGSQGRVDQLRRDLGEELLGRLERYVPDEQTREPQK
jgi:hypothetical protein